MSPLKLVFVLSLLAVSLRNVRAVSTEEKQKIHEIKVANLMECSAELGITIDDIKKTTHSVTLEGLEPCLRACVYKKTLVINDKGLYDFDKVAEMPKIYLSDEADQKKATEILKKCKSVNDQAVTDGAKGCERAVLLGQCLRPFNEMLQK